MSLTPFNLALKAFNFALKDSAETVPSLILAYFVAFFEFHLPPILFHYQNEKWPSVNR